jgi:hypothetical protein
MAELHLARVTGLDGFERTVVLKRVLPRLAACEESLRLFLREARLVASLQHPNIAQVYDVGVSEGEYFFAMEHVDGQDLRVVQWAAKRRDGGLPLAVGIGIVLGACAGLHHAHEKRGPDGQPLGIVHRDVSPSNILVSYDGWTKLVDFGIAKTANSPAETRDGSVRGKTSYLSPEQCRCEPLDRRSDVFALGIVLYELTTGRRLFLGRSELEVMKRITEEPVSPPSSVRAGYPRELERIVLKALALRREDRYQTAQELQLDLEAFARDRKLVVTAIALAGFMRGLFPDGGTAWQAELQTLRALRAGATPAGGEGAGPAARSPRDGAASGPAADEPEERSGPTHGDLPSHHLAGTHESAAVAALTALRAAQPRRPAQPRGALALVGIVVAVALGGLAAKAWRGSRPGAGGTAYAAPAPREEVGTATALEVRGAEEARPADVRPAEVPPAPGRATRPARQAVKATPRAAKARSHSPARAGRPRLAAEGRDAADRRRPQVTVLDPWPR